MMRLALIACLILLTACAQPRVDSSGASADFRAPPQAEARFADALQLMEDDAWEQALPAMESLYADYPFLSGPALNAALIHVSQDNAELADEWFANALRANPANAEAHNQYAVFLRSRGEYSLAEQHYLQALDTEPDSANTHYNLGILYDLYLGQKEQALEHFARYQALNGEEDRRVAGWIADLERQLRAGESS